MTAIRPHARSLIIRLLVTRYSLSWRDANAHLFDVAIRFVAASDEPRLILPSWRPGRYLMQNFGVNVREWSANLGKVAPNVWQADARRGDAVEVTYRYWAGVLDAGSSFLDRGEAYFNGSNLFMWVDGMRADECELTIDTDWPIATQLPRAGRQTFLARNYDHLIDSPVIAGLVAEEVFEASGATFRLMSIRCDAARFREPLRDVVREQTAVFGELPLSDYKFLIHGGDRWHGVEHEESSSIIVKRNAAEFDDHFLSIASHELFHIWNVKRMMPAAFAPYDYSRPTPTRLLWAMEGVTSYYGDLTLARSGVWSEPRYLQHLAATITELENSHARTHLSLAQASFDGWLQDPAHAHDKANAWFSFYVKGELVAALLDLTLREEGRTLDDVMRELWQQRVLDEDAVHRAAREPDFFARYVDGVEPLPYEELFATAGIAVVETRRPSTMGIRFRGEMVVDVVTQGGTGAAAGLLPGDELIAIGTTRVRSQADVPNAVARAGAECDVVFARAGTLETRRATLRDDGEVSVELRIVDEANARRREWLGRRG
jgi:predicted metalloprotease with PDZ domain